jgi:hypothetical protein
MGVRFAIEQWAACAPGLDTQDAWQAWARAPWRPEGAPEAKLEEMPALLRRRLNPLGRAAAQCAWRIHTPDPATPVVLASGYGDAQRCLHLLYAFAATGESSPTEFALSVHNAIGGLYSIARGDGAGYQAIAAGAASAAAGVIEAAGLLADGAERVLLVCYDAPLPADYLGFQREAACAYAWAWLLRPAAGDEPHLALAWEACGDDAADAHAGEDEGGLPFGLQALRFAIGAEPRASAARDGTRWTWSRHA